MQGLILSQCAKLIIMVSWEANASELLENLEDMILIFGCGLWINNYGICHLKSHVSEGLTTSVAIID